MKQETFNLAVLVHLDLGQRRDAEDIAEFQELARSAGALVKTVIAGSRLTPEAKYFIGAGKAEEVRQAVSLTGANLVLVNHNLSPSQQRNLEKLLNVRVVDRTGLILDIFAQRARTFEGKLQVELAQLEHLSTRLVRGWTHLERQKGGIGLRGPGETQLETDRRLIKNRIKTIRERLQRVMVQRQQSRKGRKRAAVPTVAFVGYTNAGKSTLFNQMTGSAVFAANLLFATLDPTLRRIQLPKIGEVVMADTVGFIRDLPHDLVAAFKATLEETRQAELLLHVVDAHQQHLEKYQHAVSAVLREIGAGNIKQLIVYNKIDLLPQCEPRLERDGRGAPRQVWLSAATGAGLNFLQEALVELLGEEMISCVIQLSPSQGKLRAELYERNAVESETELEQGGWELQVRIPKHWRDLRLRIAH